jgi:hypothetical protein
MQKFGYVWSGLAVVALTASVATVGVADAMPRERVAAATSVVGSWKVVDHNSGEVFLGTYNGDSAAGTVNFSSPNNMTTLSHGQWRRTGPNTFSDTDIALVLGADGKAASTITFRAKVIVAPGGNTADFDFEFEVTALNGTPVTRGASTGGGTRITVQPRAGS